MKYQLLPLLLVACAPPELDVFTTLDISLVDTPEAANEVFLDLFDKAEDSLHVALPSGEDTTITDALIDSWERGVDVEVVTDIDHQDDAGIVDLFDAQVPVQLADGAVTYFDFGFNQPVAWDSEDVIMSDSYAIADGVQLVNASAIGDLDLGERIIFEVVSPDLSYDLELEHNQLFGGADATSLTLYSSMQKSIADYRWHYSTQSDVMLEMWLGPQERLIKRIIDSVYSARASVWVLTNDFATEGMAVAMQTKAEHGFDVQVVVGPDFEKSSSALSKVLKQETKDVDKYQVDTARVPTVVLIDYDVARDGNRYPAKAFVLSHDLFSAARLYRVSEVVSDQLIDGNLWVLNDASGELSDEMLSLQDVWDRHLDMAEEM
ncbi:MAG: hypothetical protein HN348_09930 [Proteobacteria bacterium]|jgi:hypothetical protein|nr:hypothetical protein [Pseudomonadota bacterium]